MSLTTSTSKAPPTLTGSPSPARDEVAAAKATRRAAKDLAVVFIDESCNKRFGKQPIIVRDWRGMGFQPVRRTDRLEAYPTVDSATRLRVRGRSFGPVRHGGHRLRGAPAHVGGRHVFDVRGQRPLVPERIGQLAEAVAPK